VSRSAAQESPTGHYHTAGLALLTVGGINALIAAVGLVQGRADGFISQGVMLTFALGMVGVGGWMRSRRADAP